MTDVMLVIVGESADRGFVYFDFVSELAAAAKSGANKKSEPHIFTSFCLLDDYRKTLRRLWQLQRYESRQFQTS